MISATFNELRILFPFQGQVISPLTELTTYR